MKKTIQTALASAALVMTCAAAPPAYPPAIPAPNFSPSSTTRDGRADFNFEFGTWKTHYRLLRERLADSHDWYDCYGTSVIRPFWHGAGNLEDGDLKCPNRYVGGMTLRLYDARTRNWTLWWGTRKLAVAPPPEVGRFDSNGTGTFYAYDSWRGTPVITRFQWTKVRGNPHFEQAYSTDHGKTWETNWTTDYVRVPATDKGVWNAVDYAHDGHSGFDFLLGTWKTHYMRMRRPLTGDRDWYACEGTSTVRPFWGGSGDLEDGEINCPGHSIRGITLRIYSPATRDWMLYWGTQKGGLAQGLPQVGRFDARGVGEFFAPDTFDGKSVIVRYRWEVRNGNPHYEQAFSTDGGKTWETNWRTDYTRLTAIERPTSRH